MKKMLLLLCIPLVWVSNEMKSQQKSYVAINTEIVSPGIIFQVDAGADPGGILFPEVELVSLTQETPFTDRPAHGVIVYNTNETNANPATDVMPGYYYWENSESQWVPFTLSSKPNYIYEGSNNDTSTDFNSGSSWMDLFYYVDKNQSGALYQKLDNYTLRITETGFYRVVLNLDMKIKQSGQDRDVFGVALFLNGVQQSDRIVVRTKEYSGGTQTIGGSNVLYVYIPQGGANLAVRGFEIHGAAQVAFNSPRTSSISIERIR